MPPVSSAMSCRFAFLLSPKPGAFTAHTFRPARSLLRTREARASLSTSSAMMSSGLFSLMTASSRPTTDCRVDTFFSTSKMKGSSISTFCVLGSFTK